MARPSYAAAREHWLALQARERADSHLNPDCHSVLDHGEPTQRVVVFLHGITASPRQFLDLAQLCHARGSTVLLPRMPFHGYQDRLTPAHANLRVAHYQAYATEAVSIARGFGAHLTLAGLSVSGVIAAWCAQVNGDVDQAALIAPAFAPYGLPLVAVPTLATLATWLPNFFVWWDPRVRARLGPACSYPRFATHALAQSFRLSAQVAAAARHTPPRVRRILTITNDRDPAVNNRATDAVVRRWQAHGAEIRAHRFSDLGLIHDFIGPYQPGARVERVYPVLADLLESAGG